MDRHNLERESSQIDTRFREELSLLRKQGVIKDVDYQKVMNQLDVSRSALLETARRTDLDSAIREDLFLSLLKDYQLSIQRIIDEAVLRLGADVFVTYKFNRVNEKAISFGTEQRFSETQMRLLQAFMAGATAYALRTLPKTSNWLSPKIDFQKIIGDYSEILQEYVQSLSTESKNAGSLTIARN